MIAIKDDIIPELYQDRIYSMMTNTVFPWTFLQDVTYRENDVVKNINANAVKPDLILFFLFNSYTCLALRFEIKLEALIFSALIFAEAKILSSKLVII